MLKAYLTISEGIAEIDTLIMPGTNAETLKSDIFGTLAKYPASDEFAFTIYDSPHGLQMPVESRRGFVSDIIADMVGARV